MIFINFTNLNVIVILKRRYNFGIVLKFKYFFLFGIIIQVSVTLNIKIFNIKIHLILTFLI